MMGDYYTKDLLSRRPTTTMIGNLIDQSVSRPTGKGEAAALVLVLAMILLIPMAYYMRTTTKETERW
jgi:ABC-type spermidine/putrescine transport system permease subunit I